MGFVRKQGCGVGLREEHKGTRQVNCIPFVESLIPTVSDVLEAIRVVNLFYESRGGSSEIVTKIMDIECNLESVYWASNRKHMKITDYCTRI
jgi:hypothetical protein